MEWKDRLEHGFVINGKTYCVAHLRQFDHSFTIKALNNRELKCRIEFSSHCCSDKPLDENIPVPPELLVIDSKGTYREFCTARHEASQVKLRELIMNLDKAKLYKGDDRQNVNVFFVEFEYNGTTSVYRIFLNARKAKDPNLDMLIYIESAYLPYPKDHPRYNENSIITKRKIRKMDYIGGAIYLQKRFQKQEIVWSSTNQRRR